MENYQLNLLIGELQGLLENTVAVSTARMHLIYERCIEDSPTAHTRNGQLLYIPCPVVTLK